MKTRNVLWIILIVTGFINTAAAYPGIDVTTGSPSYSILGSSVVAEYPVTIADLDVCFDSDGDGIYDCSEKSISSVTVEPNGWSGTGWSYSFDPDPTIFTIAPGTAVFTTLSVIAPAGTVPDIYAHKVTVDVHYQSLFITDDPDTHDDESIAFESDYDFFNTEISGSTPIPEFPTVALPIISVLGLVFLMRRRK